MAKSGRLAGRQYFTDIMVCLQPLWRSKKSNRIRWKKRKIRAITPLNDI